MLPQLKTANFGSFKSNLTGASGVGYAILNTAGSVTTPRTTTGVYQIASGSGMYAAFVSFSDNFHGSIVWDTGEAIPKYAVEQYNYEENNPNADIITTITSSISQISGTVNSNNILLNQITGTLNTDTVLLGQITGTLNIITSSVNVNNSLLNQITGTLSQVSGTVNQNNTLLKQISGTVNQNNNLLNQVTSSLSTISGLVNIISGSVTMISGTVNISAGEISIISGTVILDTSLLYEISGTVNQNNVILNKNNLLLNQITGTLGTITGSIGLINSQIQFLVDMEGGRWKIDAPSNRMNFYKSDNTTIVASFSLFDVNGIPTSDLVAERRRL